MAETGQPIAKAYVAKSYKVRLGIIALACLGFAAWFFYDGAVKYPAEMELFQKHQELEKSGDPNWNQQWVQVLTERGLDPTYQVTERREMDIFTQYLMGALVLPVGLVFGWSFLRSQGRWIAADDTGLHTSWGQHAPWASLKTVDKSRWKSKGIAVVRYTDPSGSEQKITLDDWKYDRGPTVAIAAEVDRHLGITDGGSGTTTDAPQTTSGVA